MQLVEWGSVSNNPDIQAAYSAFHRIFERKGKCRKLSKLYHSNKSWLTNVFKEIDQNKK